jgi:predicted SnoaL-like aldol condensation-catalyzing enzyme
MMKAIRVFAAGLALLSVIGAPALAQVPVAANSNHAALLASKDPGLARNKRFVYDFWREVFEAGHMELAPKYMAETYIQHNPNVATGRQPFIDFFSKMKKPVPIPAQVQTPLVDIVAQRDIVILVFARELKDPVDPTKTYSTTWFDMFRIVNGKVAEHWDAATKPDKK